MSVTRHLRLLTAALLLAGSGAVALGTPAATAAAPRCPDDGASIQTHTMDADDVFTGSVTDRAREGDQVVYTVAVDRVYKGDVDIPEVSVTTDRAARACGLPDLATGSPYVFFTSGEDLSTAAASGTAEATEARVARLVRLLGEGRAPTPPEPDTATFTRVAGAPTSLERVAAPGLALVIVGLLGLGLAAGLDRRRA
ncbi:MULTISPECIES: hypothetical protein [unclassified Nocardioides]|uniref:hypothetical protein n=1 Tax=unclassified Nocardioides TaxID=2615069 RepID=UPI00105694F5|nr:MULTISPECIES: hypothetical protein [unclassified Nocardioides]